MKKFAASIALIASLLIGVGYAAETYIIPQGSQRSLPYSPGPQTLLSAVTTTGAGDSFYFGTPMTSHTVQVIISGVTPTSVVVSLQGSIDGTTWDTLQTSDSLTADTMFHVVNKPVNRVRGNLVTHSTSSTSGTTVTMKYFGQQP